MDGEELGARLAEKIDRECREYTCAACGGTFHDTWTEADAIKEYEEVFSEEMRAAGDEPPARICDDCYQKMIAERPPAQAWDEYRKRWNR